MFFSNIQILISTCILQGFIAIGVSKKQKKSLNKSHENHRKSNLEKTINKHEICSQKFTQRLPKSSQTGDQILSFFLFFPVRTYTRFVSNLYPVCQYDFWTTFGPLPVVQIKHYCIYEYLMKICPKKSKSMNI